MNKEQYEDAVMEVTLFDNEDIIVTSEHETPIIPDNGMGDVSE